MSKLVFSHGFGVMADARGLFTEIARNFPEYQSAMFDYNTVAEDGGIIVSPIDEQVSILESYVNGNDDSYLIAHSQGSVVAALANLPRLKGVILLAPPTTIGMKRVIEEMKNRPGAEINLEGMSKYPRSDGTFTYLTKEYINSLDNIDSTDMYNDLASRQTLTIIRATGDDVLGETNFDSVINAEVIDIAANHDFTDDGRKLLMGKLKAIIKENI